MMTKRSFDIIFSLLALVILLPFIMVISLLVFFSSPGGIFYRQNRVGKNNQDFSLIKFRTMLKGSDKKGLLTTSRLESQITPAGKWLRKYKLDELPQLFNVLAGEMSIVGPRPEVRKYVELYTTDQKKVLTVKPGLTDYASLKYFNENEILNSCSDPEEAYIRKIMPEKLKLNLRYINEQGMITDLQIIGKTIRRILS